MICIAVGKIKDKSNLKDVLIWGGGGDMQNKGGDKLEMEQEDRGVNV